jgi:hypothetical protein
MLSSFGTSRKRRISVGPQSEADAREYLANRDQRRKADKLSAASIERLRGARLPPPPEYPPSPAKSDEDRSSTRSSFSSPSSLHVRPFDKNLLTPPASDAGYVSDSGREDEKSGREEEKSDRDMFDALLKPRVRYDAEVITKIVVYAGIGWLAVEGDPLLFEWLGLT